uniref:Uncharacterized protein n=1 Tax=Anopheles melas TaxID=34690 RepID=A0A182U0J8_9DIPT
MQHASFLYRQRTLRGLRTTLPTSASGYQISSFKNTHHKWAAVPPSARCRDLARGSLSRGKPRTTDDWRRSDAFGLDRRNNPILPLLGTPQPRTLYFLVEAKSRVREVYAQTCHHFSKQGMLDTELFGLAVLIAIMAYGPRSSPPSRAFKSSPSISIFSPRFLLLSAP